MSSELDVVTGALSYSGRYIAPLDFDNPLLLSRRMEGASVLYNTYWVRFPWAGGITHSRAVENTRVLFNAAREAGVRRIVHVGIANAAADSPLSYYRGKAELEKALAESGLSYAVVRPTVLFGAEKHAEDVLINNIAWILRRFPLFVVPGDGTYRVQPVHVDDFAGMVVDAGAREDSFAMDAAGPETFSFDGLVRTVAAAVKSRCRIVHVAPRLALLAVQIIGEFVDDVILTSDEIKGLMAGLLASHEPPRGTTLFSKWIEENNGLLGVKYASEMERHYL